MTIATGRGRGLVTEKNRSQKDRMIAALCAIPIAKLQQAAANCMGCPVSAVSTWTRGRLVDTIGPYNALKLACSCGCVAESLGSLLGDPGSDFVQGGAPIDPGQVQPSIPSSSDFPDIPNAPPAPPASSGQGASPKLPPDGFPASPPFRPGNWKNDGSGKLLPSYFIASGDTWSGLARLYLGGPTRWKELWSPNKGQFPSPDKLDANVFVVMPEEARAAAQALLDKQLAPVAPPSPGAPGSVPGAAPIGPGASPLSGWTTGQKIAAGAAGLAIVGGIGYAVLK